MGPDISGQELLERLQQELAEAVEWRRDALEGRKPGHSPGENTEQIRETCNAIGSVALALRGTGR